MKKLSVIVLSSLVLGSSIYFNQFSNKVLYVSNSVYNQSSNIYQTHILDENGEEYTVNTYDNLTNKWIDATVKNNQVISFKIMD